jgi:hypothetical protein
MKRLHTLLMVLLSVLAICIMATGCSTTGGYLGHSIQTEVQLGQANFDVVKSVTGEAQADYYFGIGPSQQDLFAQAKRAMIAKASLKGSQALVNVTTDIKVSGFLIWCQKKAYVSAEVVQFK